MSTPRFAPVAREDLINIWLYVAADSEQAADNLLDRIHHTCQVLADSPGIGRERPELRQDCRSFAVGHFIIFYQQADEGIDVLRVLHGARDLPPLFGNT